MHSDIGLIVVVLAGDYNNPEDWVMPVRIVEEHVTPELHRMGKCGFAAPIPRSQMICKILVIKQREGLALQRSAGSR